MTLTPGVLSIFGGINECFSSFQLSANPEREQHSNRVPHRHRRQERLLGPSDRRAGLGQDDHDQLSHEEVLDGDPRPHVVHVFVDDDAAAVPGEGRNLSDCR